jgi:hypothetical protein
MPTKRYFPNTCDELLSSTAPSRASVDRLVTRARVLSQVDRALIATIYLKHQSVAAVAQLQGTPVRTLRRHLYRIIRRVHTPEFIFVMRRRAQWPAQQRRVATAIFLQGLTMHQAVRELQLPYFTVRRFRDIVLTLITSALDESAPPKKDEEPEGDKGTEKEQRGDWTETADEDWADEIASQSPSLRDATLKFPTTSRFGEVA